MRVISCFFAVVLFLVLFTTGTQFASCTKEIVHDTVTVKDTLTIKDTLVKTDTVTVIDSSCAACYDLTDGLIAYYNFNGGNLNDSSGNNNHIQFNNAVKTTDRFGRANNAYLFDGSSSYMRVPNSTSLNPEKISIMAIIKVNGFYTGPCHGNSIVTKGSPDAIPGFYTLRFNDASPDRCNQPVNTSTEVFNAGFQNSGIQADTSIIATDKWINVVYTYDGLTSNIYVNGALKQTETLADVNAGNALELFIGKNDSVQFPYWFNGVMDEIRIYNRDLCLGEVKALNNLKN